MEMSIIDIRCLWRHEIFIMIIPILVIWHLYVKTAPEPDICWSNRKFHKPMDNEVFSFQMVPQGFKFQCEDGLSGYRDFHYEYKMLVRLSNLHNGNSYSDNMISLSWMTSSSTVMLLSVEWTIACLSWGRISSFVVLMPRKIIENTNTFLCSPQTSVIGRS